LAVVVAAFAIVGPIALAVFDTLAKGHEVASTIEATLEGDGPPLRIGIEDGRAMAAALARAVNDPNLLAASKVPVELLRDLPSSVGDAQITSGGQLRAGAWLATSAAAGPRWEYRMSLPQPPRIGLMFRAPLFRDQQGWSVSAIEFVRVR
jgi:hypothetical protein